MNIEIIHNLNQSRFEAHIGHEMALIDYIRTDHVLDIVHTKVPPALEGQGIAAAITKAILTYAQDHNLKIKPTCPYTAAYIKRHPEYSALVVLL